MPDQSFLQLLHDPAMGEAMRHLGDSFLDKFGARLGDGAARFTWRSFLRVIKREHDGGDLTLRLGRLESTVEGLSDALSEGSFVFRDDEFQEPAAQAFADQAISDATASPSDGKRRILGRMIAHRLASKTESVYELFLRDARIEVASLNESQLALLATLFALSYTPLPKEETEERVAPFVTERVVPVFNELAKVDPTRSDAEKLLADDVLIETDNGLSEHGSYIDVPRLRLAPYGISQGSATSEHVINAAQHFRQEKLPYQSPSRGTGLRSLWLTPKGAVIAALVLEAHFHERIYFPEWEALEEVLPAAALVAPFSSADLVHYCNQRDATMRKQLKSTLERLAPKIVANDIEKNSHVGRLRF